MNDITKLIDLKEVYVTDFVFANNVYTISIDSPVKSCNCPRCREPTKRVHDYRQQIIKDLPLRNNTVLLSLRKRRLVCLNCGKKFYQKPPFLPKYYRMTNRLIESIINQMRENYSMKDIAKRHNVSVSTPPRVFSVVNYKLYRLPTVLSFDEFKGNSGGNKYHAILTNPEKHKVLDILPNREQARLLEYFRQFNDKDRVKFVVMDMWKPYFDLAGILFPKAIVIIDKYHYIRQVYWALENVRKRIQKSFNTENRLIFKRSKSLLRKPFDSLSYDNQDYVRRLIDKHTDLFNAWQLKELFLKFKHSKNSKDGEIELNRWIETALEAALPEFNDAVRAFINWKQPILNSLDYPYTNGFTEGINNKIKVLKRNAFGFRNFDRFRNRILHCSN